MDCPPEIAAALGREAGIAPGANVGAECDLAGGKGVSTEEFTSAVLHALSNRGMVQA